MTTASANAPASSGNLGPGFDVLALALEVRCVCAAEPAERWEIFEYGRLEAAHPGDLVIRAVSAAVGDRPMRITIENEIPRSRGLGSSSAVVAAAAAAAMRATGREPSDRFLYELVADLEGHPDNAAAAVYGGLVAAQGDVIRRLPMWDGLRIVVGIPESKLSTRTARAKLPASLPHRAAARSVARTVFLLEGLRTGDIDAFRLALGDEIHEAPRSALSPITGELIDAAIDAGAHHAAWSGAGPSALAFCDDDHVADVMAALKSALAGSGEVRELAVAMTGWS